HYLPQYRLGTVDEMSRGTHARVVDQCVQPSPTSGHLVEQATPISRNRNISGNWQYNCPGRRQPASLAPQRFARAGGDGNPRSQTGGKLGQVPANAAGGAGDQDAPAAQFPHHELSPSHLSRSANPSQVLQI